MNSELIASIHDFVRRTGEKPDDPLLQAAILQLRIGREIVLQLETLNERFEEQDIGDSLAAIEKAIDSKRWLF